MSNLTSSEYLSVYHPCNCSLVVQLRYAMNGTYVALIAGATVKDGKPSISNLQ